MRPSRAALFLVALAAFPAAPAEAAFTSTLKKRTLILTQTADDGPVTVDDHALGQGFRVHEGGTTEFESSDSLVVKLLPNGNPVLDIDLDFGFLRDLTVQLGDGPRTVRFVGADNSVGGNLKIVAGDGVQTIEFAVAASFQCGGRVQLDLGGGFDPLDATALGVNVAGDVDLVGVDFVEVEGPFIVGGDFDMSTVDDPAGVIVRLDNDDTMIVLGDLRFETGSGGGSCLLNADTVVGGDVTIDCGPADTSQVFSLLNARIGGDVTIRVAGQGGAVLSTSSTSAYGGNIEIDLTNGPNQVVLSGMCGGKKIELDTGAAADTVQLQLLARRADVDLNLRGESDLVTVTEPLVLKSLSIAFGKGADTFDDPDGATERFETDLDGLP